MPTSSAVAAPRLPPHPVLIPRHLFLLCAPQLRRSLILLFHGPRGAALRWRVQFFTGTAPRFHNEQSVSRSVAQAPLLAVPVRRPPVAAQHAAVGLPWCLCESVARAEPTRHSRNTRRGGLFRKKRLRLFSVVHRRLRAVPGVMPSHTEGRHAYRLAATDCRNLGSASPTGPRRAQTCQCGSISRWHSWHSWISW